MVCERFQAESRRAVQVSHYIICVPHTHAHYDVYITCSWRCRYGQFYGGDSYVVRYDYVKSGKEQTILYFWLGRESSIDEKGSAALLTKELDDSLGGAATQVPIVTRSLIHSFSHSITQSLNQPSRVNFLSHETYGRSVWCKGRSLLTSARSSRAEPSFTQVWTLHHSRLFH